MNGADEILRQLRRRHGAKWTVYPDDVIPAWVADMDFAVAAPIRAALEAAVARGDLGYPLPYARSGLDELFCARMARRYGWQVEPTQVQFFSDVVQAIYLALLTLTRAGSGVLIQTPIYPPFLTSVAETGRSAQACPLVAGPRGYEIDFDALDGCVTRDTEMLLLCHPHNPTGRAFTREELTRLADLALRHDLIVVADEIHADLMLDARQHLPFASLGPEIAARTLTLTSPSKPFNIAGLCLAVGVFGSPALAQRFASLPEHVRGGRSALGMAAARAAWSEGDAWLNDTLALLRRNRAQVAAFVAARWPSVVHYPPEATYLAWLDLRPLALPQEPQRYLLEHARVALGDGPAFGAPGQGFVRLNFATEPAVLEEVLGRMDHALRQSR
jgi:cystathionine beta-lyase